MRRSASPCTWRSSGRPPSRRPRVSRVRSRIEASPSPRSAWHTLTSSQRPAAPRLSRRRRRSPLMTALRGDPDTRDAFPSLPAIDLRQAPRSTVSSSACRAAGDADIPDCSTADDAPSGGEWRGTRAADANRHSAKPRYPESLRQAGHRRPRPRAVHRRHHRPRRHEPAFKILESTHDLFTRAVRDVLPASASSQPRSTASASDRWPRCRSNSRSRVSAIDASADAVTVLQRRDARGRSPYDLGAHVTVHRLRRLQSACDLDGRALRVLLVAQRRDRIERSPRGGPATRRTPRRRTPRRRRP